MQAYHNDPVVKEKYVGRVKAHRAADQIIQGTGWDGSKGCAVGCTLENYEHKQYPIELGIPIQLAYVEDSIFEGLPLSVALDWPERFLQSIPVGADLSKVSFKFTLWILLEVITYVTDNDIKKYVQETIDIYVRWVSGTIPTEQDFRAALDARAALAALAALAARDALAALAALAARDARDALAALDARDARDALAALDALDALDARDARAARRDKFWIKASDKLIELLAESK